MTSLFRRLRARWRYRHFDRDLAREIDVHRAMKQDEIEASGVAPDDARAATARALGNVTYMREEARSIWIARWLEHLWQDLRYALRGLRRQPLFALTAIGILGLSTGLLTTVIMVADAAFLRPWRVPDPSAVFLIRPAVRLASDLHAIRIPEYHDVRTRTRAWQALSIAYRGAGERLTFANGVVASPAVAYVSANYFDTLDVSLAAGRMFSAAEDSIVSAEDVIVISHRIWKEHLNADPAAIGTTVRMRGFGGRPFTIVGVGPRGFIDGLDSRHEVWVPASLRFGATPAERQAYLDPRHPSISTVLIGRLSEGVSPEQGLAELELLSNGYRAAENIEQTRFRLVDTRPISSGNRDTLYTLLLIAGALLLVQLLACANVGNLLLARALARRREIAVRLSLGAGRIRVVRQLLTEAAMLIVVAAGLGLAMALGVPYIVFAFVPDFEQRPEFFGPGIATFTVLVAMAAVCTLVAGLAPALRATSGGLSAIAGNRHGQAPGGVRLRRILLVAQMAFATVLLSGAGLLTRGLAHAMTVEPGFPIAEFQEVTIDLPGAGNQRARRRAFYKELFAQTRAADWPPVALTDIRPIEDSRFSLFVQQPSSSGVRFLTVRSRPVSANYFDVLGVPLLAGRMPAPDSDGREIVVNRLAAALLWPNEDPLGKTMATGMRTEQLVMRTVVGSVRDLPTTSVVESEPVAYSSDYSRPFFLVRSQDPGVVSRLENIAKSLEPVATVSARPLSAAIEDSLFWARIGSQIAWAIGIIGLVLATVGAFGVFAYAVEERRREVGIRMALGARAPQVIALVLRSTQTTVALGLVIGVALAGAAAPLLRKYLYGLSPYNPIAYLQVAVILAAAAALATWLPARRATRVNPAEALRAE
jgi:predicted permease